MQAGRGGAEPEKKPAGPALSVREFWRLTATTWDSVAALDLHERFGIDQLDPTLPERPWWWLRNRILGLLDLDSRLARTLTKED